MRRLYSNALVTGMELRCQKRRNGSRPFVPEVLIEAALAESSPGRTSPSCVEKKRAHRARMPKVRCNFLTFLIAFTGGASCWFHWAKRPADTGCPGWGSSPNC